MDIYSYDGRFHIPTYLMQTQLWLPNLQWTVVNQIIMIYYLNMKNYMFEHGLLNCGLSRMGKNMTPSVDSFYLSVMMETMNKFTLQSHKWFWNGIFFHVWKCDMYTSWCFVDVVHIYSNDKIACMYLCHATLTWSIFWARSRDECSSKSNVKGQQDQGQTCKIHWWQKIKENQILNTTTQLKGNVCKYSVCQLVTFVS